MKCEMKKFSDINLVTFSIDIKQKQHKSGTWKKEIHFKKDWDKYTLENTYFNEKYNGLALVTGKINDIIVIDIDNVDHWKSFLNDHDRVEPDTVKVKSGSGGIHLYFKYTDDLKNLKSNTKCFGQKYDIDIRTNGGCIIVPPTKYFNKNLNKEVEYTWEKSLFEYELKKIPPWMEKILSEKRTEKKKKTPDEKFQIEKTSRENMSNNNSSDDSNDNDKKQLKINNLSNLENLETLESLENTDEANLNYTINDIETLVNMLSEFRCENYNDWVNVGMCLNNIDQKYLIIWVKWSQKSNKYEEGKCEEKWKSFKKSKDGLKIGSLLMWAKNDSPEQYIIFIKKKKINGMITSKYPEEKLLLGDTIFVNNRNHFTNLKNKDCLIKGCEHPDMPNSMYVDVLDKFMTIKCRHHECFGKTYPCNHILMTKNEMNIAFNGDVTININNQDDELVEFQQIDIYEDQILNELVFNSLNGEHSRLAQISYYFFKDIYIFGEDNNWYNYENHKWNLIGQKNPYLRSATENKLVEIYDKLMSYYKDNSQDKNKLKTLKNVKTTLGRADQKNNIMTELAEVFLLNKNKKRDFTKKLDSNNYIIGFDNGVYDLKKFEFREGKPDDYITLSTGYDYQENHTEKYKDLLNFLEDIQPNKEERDYMLTYLSIGLVGNLLELFTILTGSGRNGKSKLIELLKETMGDYFGSVQSQLFTRPRPDANSPDPGLLSLLKKRIVMASEPEKNNKLNSGFIKFITGRDSTTLRNCHSNDMVDFTAKFITLLICNDIPECDDMDNAFTKRLRCINFPTEFVNEPTKDYQKKINVNINQNFDCWKLDFILLLIDYYKKYSKTHELKTTDNILKWTNQYKENTDMYLLFLNENTEEKEGENIHCVTLYGEFKVWFLNNNPNTRIPSNREFVNNLRKHKDIKDIKIDGIPKLGIKNLTLKN
jgi:P4 family phage/plasmid primase-like protien